MGRLPREVRARELKGWWAQRTSVSCEVGVRWPGVGPSPPAVRVSVRVRACVTVSWLWAQARIGGGLSTSRIRWAARVPETPSARTANQRPADRRTPPPHARCVLSSFGVGASCACGQCRAEDASCRRRWAPRQRNSHRPPASCDGCSSSLASSAAGTHLNNSRTPAWVHGVSRRAPGLVGAGGGAGGSR